VTPTVLTRVEERIGQLVLNRPEAMNAITVELACGLERALLELADDVDVIVVRGAGGNFSVGGDFTQLEGLRAEGEAAMAELFAAFGRACATIAKLAVPVVAAVEGCALAGGFELMLACDVALVRDDAWIADHHANFGVVPGGGSTQRLPRLVGRQRALGLILTGDRLSGAEAVAWGLACRSVPAAEFEAAVAELAVRLAGRDRESQAQIKRLVHEGLELRLAEGLARERAAVVEHLAAARSVAWPNA
jgi:enoyl-CoA hydratase/carnithine racemase